VAKLFISQKRLDDWSAEERVTVDGNRLQLSNDDRSFTLEPAVHFVKVAGGSEDPHNLVGKVKTVAALEKDGAEHFISSVIKGDTAYDVQPGFLGTPLPKGS